MIVIQFVAVVGNAFVPCVMSFVELMHTLICKPANITKKMGLMFFQMRSTGKKPFSLLSHSQN
jgi:hypothetical protein